MQLNLGCGENIRAGFINIDIRNLAGVDLVADVSNLESIESGSVSSIVAQNILQYIPREKMLSTLEEWKRVLRPSGILEIRVTDISAVTKSLYMNSISKEMGLSHEMVLALLYGKQNHKYDIRYNGFTNEFLQGVLAGIKMKTTNTISEEFDIILTVKKI